MSGSGRPPRDRWTTAASLLLVLPAPLLLLTSGAFFAIPWVAVPLTVAYVAAGVGVFRGLGWARILGILLVSVELVLWATSFARFDQIDPIGVVLDLGGGLVALFALLRRWPSDASRPRAAAREGRAS